MQAAAECPSPAAIFVVAPAQGAPLPLLLPAVDTTLVPLEPSRPVILLSLCAGLVPELEVLLRLGFRVRFAFAVDTDRSLVPVWTQLLSRLKHTYSHTVHPSFDASFSTAFPSDLELISPPLLISTLAHMMQTDGCVLFISAGWPCQARSRAGRGLGRVDPRSALFDHVATLISATQHSWPGRVNYLLENVPVTDSDLRPAVQSDESLIRSVLGAPIRFDAVEAGSLAHRDRSWWTNSTTGRRLEAVLSRITLPSEGPF